MIKTLSVDIETFSSNDLAKCGVYKYVEIEDFEVLLFAYSVNHGPVSVIDLVSGEEIPEEIMNALTDDSVQKWAFNANFERVCLSRYLGYPTGQYLNPDSWYCTMVWSASIGLPLSLESVGKVLGLTNQKLKEGKSLIRYFCVPCKPTKVNGGRIRNLPVHAPEDWKVFKDYNKRDVEVELGIKERLTKFPLLDKEWRHYHQDQLINDCGIALDREFVEQAIRCDDLAREQHLEEAKKTTALENPNSPMQLKEWLNDQGLKIESLAKKEVEEAIKTATGKVERALELRQELSKSSVKKYEAMQNVVGSDGRARGLIQFYGASRTGRYSGRLIQVQNLPRNYLTNLEEARELVKAGQHEAIELLFGSTSNTLSELIRTAFIPKEGHRFLVVDFSAIEARVLAWLAGEEWRMTAFESGKDIYCESASQMFGVPVVKHGVNGELRQKGKVAELACGYGGSVGALKAMGALEMGLEKSELQQLVDDWRESSPNIVELWWAVDRCAKDTIKGRMRTETHGIVFSYQSGILFIQLPSGRKLAYCKPRIGENRFGGESIEFEGIGTGNKWQVLETYGAKLVENITQAIARDILAEAMYRLRDYRIVMHVHDEIIIEGPNNGPGLADIRDIMIKAPSWAKGLVLDADGFQCQFYQKD